MRNIRSSIAAYPAPNSMSSKVAPVMNGTPNASRWMVSPGRGDFVLTTVAGVKSSRLYSWSMSARRDAAGIALGQRVVHLELVGEVGGEVAVAVVPPSRAATSSAVTLPFEPGGRMFQRLP